MPKRRALINLMKGKSSHSMKFLLNMNKTKLNLVSNLPTRVAFLELRKQRSFFYGFHYLADGSFAYTLVHAKESPFRLQPKPRSLVSVKGEINRGKLNQPIVVREIAFMDDPRIIIIPLYWILKSCRYY